MTYPFLLASLLLPLGAAPEPSAPEDAEAIADSFGVQETRFDVLPRDTARRAPPEVDAPAVGQAERAASGTRAEANSRSEAQASWQGGAPLVSLDRRDTVRGYLDPFAGREVVPELGVRVSTGFVREKLANQGEPGGSDGRMALASRIDVSLWIVDVRVPANSQERVGDEPIEWVLRVPIELGRHRIAPLAILHAPPRASLGRALFEAGVGYHYVRDALSLKLEVSAFAGSHDRRSAGLTGGMLGADAFVGYFLHPRAALGAEAEITIALSEREGDRSPALGDTVVRVLPGARFFPSSGFSVGVFGLLSLVPDGYRISRRQGAFLELSYEFL